MKRDAGNQVTGFGFQLRWPSSNRRWYGSDACLGGTGELKRRYPIVGDVDGLGLALRLEICEPHDSFTPSKAIVDRMVDIGLEGDLEVDGKTYGLVLDIGGYYKNVVTLAPSLHITKHEMDLGLKLLDRVLHRVSRQ